MNLIYKNEKPLFIISALIAAIFWLALLVGTFGILLIYLLLGYVFFLFAHSGFISHLKGSGVKISADQYPDLYEKLVKGCEKVGLKEVPEAYLLRTDFFNALATKFLGRHFVVLFTDVVDALEDQPNAIDFYIGHELGHIHRKHLSWSSFLMPASVFPLLGAALRRSEEYTCDRYGVACCESEDDIKAAIAAIAAGDSRWKTINIDAYLKQVADTRGFWMSFNELTADYPWLTKRMAAAVAMKRDEKVKHPRRHAFAWFLAAFIPRIGGGSGGAGSLLITIAIIGILAAVAVPAYQDYITKAHYSTSYNTAESIKVKVTEYVIDTNQWPESMQSLGFDEATIMDDQSGYEIGIYSDGIIGVTVGINSDGEEQYIVLEPEVIEGDLSWICYGTNVEEKNLPQDCR
ncbi:MAG: M48 family metalloprotease [Oleispira sp.]|nr:M48 family metalloprotease [Oleispira sp.]MBL4879947.1 M48 family metalloprotease [Oleispira sp.]